MKHSKMIIVVLIMITLNISTVSKNKAVDAFQPLSILTPPSRSTTTSTTVLNVKFKLDNDDENNTSFSVDNVTSNNNDPSTLQQLQLQQDSTNNDEQQQLFQAPSTTFGAEAVPEAQRPANEYMELLASPLFDWANKNDFALLARLSILYVVLFGLVCWPISAATFTMDGYELHQFFSSNIGAIGFVLIMVMRLYTGWGYVGSRLQSKEIEYEETGWYVCFFYMTITI